MADEKTEEKTKKTVPGMERSFKGIAKHVDDVLAQNWDREKRSFRDPFTCWLALFTYSRLLATLIDEAEERAAKDKAAFEKRIAEFETRLTTMERWKDAAEAQTAEMVKAADELMRGGESAIKSQLRTFLDGPQIVALPSPAPVEKNGEQSNEKDDVA